MFFVSNLVILWMNKSPDNTQAYNVNYLRHATTVDKNMLN